MEGHELYVGRVEPRSACRQDALPAMLAQRRREWGGARTHGRRGSPRRGGRSVCSRRPTRYGPRPRPRYASCRRSDFAASLLTGDNEATAQAVAASIGITEVVAAALPADKVAIIRRLQDEGRQGWRWWATASTMPQRWRLPTSGLAIGSLLWHRRCDQCGGPDHRARRPVCRRNGDRPGAPDVEHDSWQPRLGIPVQPRGDPDRRVWPAQPLGRGRSHGALVELRRLEQLPVASRCSLDTRARRGAHATQATSPSCSFPVSGP